MKIIRRMAWIWLACALLTGCSTLTPLPPVTAPERPTATQPAERAPFTLTLAYDRADGLDPFKMTTRVNRDLAGLLYEGLWAYGPEGAPLPCLAEALVSGPLTLTVTLRADARFSDGSPVTAAEVIASFEAAKASDAYGSCLHRFKEAAAGEGGEVIFTLSEREPFPAAALTFPVVKQGEEGLLGSGPYVYDPSPGLTLNPLWGNARFTSIRLLDLTDEEERFKGLELGHVSFVFTDLSAGQPARVSGASAPVPMEYLLFLGINSARPELDGPVRRGMDKALNRTRLAAVACGGYAVPASCLFPDGFAAAAGFAPLFSPVSQREEALTLLEETSLALTLAVNEESEQKTALAQQVAEQLGTVGITVTVTALPYKDYLYALRHGRYDLYIGEIRLPAGMDLDPLLKKGGSAFYGPSERDGAVIAWSSFCAGETDAEGLNEAFAAALPYIPLCWRCGLAAYHRGLTDVTPTGYDPYAGITGWNIIE